MTLSDELMLKVHIWYEKKGIAFERQDRILWNFWLRVFPYMVTIPLLYWFLKFIFVDFMLKKYGFDYTIITIAIILMIKPLVMSVLERLMKVNQ